MIYSVEEGWLKQNGARVDYVGSIFMGGAFLKVPKIAVVHFTYGGTALSSAQWFRDRRNPGSSAHVVIERDGEVIQCVPFGREAWHAGRSRWRGLSGLNRHSFGIELANWGYLQKAGQRWQCWTGATVSDPLLATHKAGNPDGRREPIGWERYPEAQFEAAVAVLHALREAYGINEIVGHDDIAPTRKWDPGPAFHFGRCRASVFGGRGADGAVRLRATPQRGLNLRSGPAIRFRAIELLARGTALEPIRTDGVWTEVSVLDGEGEPRASGWIHSRYVEED